MLTGGLKSLILSLGGFSRNSLMQETSKANTASTIAFKARTGCVLLFHTRRATNPPRIARLGPETYRDECSVLHEGFNAGGK